jgi:hypothetical protein
MSEANRHPEEATPFPAPPVQRIVAILPDELAERLRRATVETKDTISGFVATAVADALARLESSGRSWAWRDPDRKR